MSRKAIFCAILGHRWSPARDVHDVNPVLECGRCGRRQVIAAGSNAAGYGSRLNARTGADRSVGPSGGRR